MNKLTLAAVLLSPITLLAQAKPAKPTNTGQPFLIEGTVTDQKNPLKAFFMMRTGGQNIIDSTEVLQGHFTFKGSVSEPTQATLLFKPQANTPPDPLNPYKRDRLAIFVDKGTTKVTTKDSISKATVTGSKAQVDFEGLNNSLKDIMAQSEVLQKQYRELYNNKDTAAMKALEPKFEELEASEKTIYADFLKAHPASPIAMYVLNNYAGYDINVAEVEPVFAKISPAVKATPAGKEFAQRLTVAQKTAVGQQALTFSQADTTGKSVSLEDFKGKYVLVDFWASWCGPCRAENPNVVKAYNTYKDKGFTVLSVSLDDNKEKWEEAIAKDGLLWTHVSDLKGWKNAVAEQYGIRAIPQNVLLDPQGKIIGKNLRGDALDKKLEEAFASK
ncbi:Peroxiredoxin [Chitinophaga costaii]|uniref:Peroxiredoxin n=1 Tax=Chitinophaga costaii TaxID=1335309 RepID=A0A1C3ZJQ2_9BACT|nr:TlpA disulfide reductase family protein [Chitinophaga costaii]PUZ30403.1 AhpC/TSA family protein [Chitinophaga costaii]SCB82581.1 Peroxiredoxin [Chitinophaga costaii]